MAQYFVTKTDPQDTVRQDRIWLRITPKNSFDDLVSFNPDIDAQTSTFITDNLKAAWIDDSVDIFIPLSGDVPTNVFFQHKYGSGAPELSMQTRGIAQFAGLGLEHLASAIAPGKDSWAAGLREAVSKGTMGLGEIIAAYSGGITGPSIWEGTSINAIELAGAVAFESLSEYNYYKAVEQLLQLMSTPHVTTNNDFILKAVEKLIGRTVDPSSPLAQLQIWALKAPQTQCDIEIFAGKPIYNGNAVSPSSALFANVRTIVDIEPTNANTITTANTANRVLLFSLKNAYLSNISIIHGVDGKGFDATGLSRYMSYKLTITPRGIDDLIKGQQRIMKEYGRQYKEILALPTVSAENAAVDGLRALMYQVLNISNTAQGALVMKAKGQNFTGIGKSLVASNGKSFKNNPVDWGVTKMLAEQANPVGLARMVF
jgi:hypothetical protein